MRAKKSLGQHFLLHASIAERIAEAAHLTKEDTVFEIGPGKGILTRALLARAGTVIALEADEELFAQMSVTFAEEMRSGKLLLLHADIRAFDPATLAAPYKVVANIPYYLTGEIFRLFLSTLNQPASMTLLVQKEVAERIAREKKESLLSLSVKAYGTPKYVFTVSKGAFVPPPKVDSTVLTISDISRRHFAKREDEERFFKLIHAGFAHKRKQLAGNLKKEGFDLPEIAKGVRAEDLSLADWLHYTHLLS